MKVTARDIQSAWLDRSEDTYHTENKPVGKDRKSVEGPFQTQEDFPNSWLPTEQAKEEAFMAVEVTEVEVAVKQAAGDVLPGVSSALFNAWNNAHEAGADFSASRSFHSLERFADALTNFLNEAIKIGSSYARSVIRTVKNFPANNAPRAGQEGYDSFETEELHIYLDKILNATHSEVLGLTGTDRTDWYSVMQAPNKHETTPVMYLSPEEYEELGMQPRVSPSELRDRRGPGAPFLEDLWRRKRDTELKGMKVKAIDVMRPEKPQIDDTPQPESEISPEVDAAEQKTNANILLQPISYWDWEDDPDIAVPGSVFHYRKSVELEEEPMSGDWNRMEIYTFVEPNANRKKRLLERAKSLGRGRGDALLREAEGTPDVGYINDIEIFYKDELLFHRERSFMPKRPALSQREFMSGDALQRAITDVQQFVRTKIDPVPVGQFIQTATANPGKGEAKLSMRVEAADVIRMDPKRRVRKGPKAVEPERGFGLGPSKRLQDWFSQEDLRDPGVEDFIREQEQEGPGGVPYDNPLEGSDLEGLMYMFDTAASGLEEIASAFIKLQPGLPPEQQKEIGKVIAKIRAAIRALSPETKPLR